MAAHTKAKLVTIPAGREAADHPSMTIREFLRSEVDGYNITSLARKTKISRTSLERHVKYKCSISPKNAMKIQRWSMKTKTTRAISAVKSLGIKDVLL